VWLGFPFLAVFLDTKELQCDRMLVVWACVALSAEILRCVGLHVRADANVKEKESAHFAQNDNVWVVVHNGYPGGVL
jgi:hypothetical protein